MSVFQLPKESHPDFQSPGIKPIDGGIRYNKKFGPVIDFYTFINRLHNEGIDVPSLQSGASLGRNKLITTDSAGLILDKPQYAGLSELTIIIRARYNTLATRDGLFGQGGPGNWSLNLGFTNSDRMFMYWGTGDNFSSEFIPTVGNVVVGEDRTYVVTFDGSRTPSDRVRLWIEGRQETLSWNVDPISTVPDNNADDVIIGRGDAGAFLEVEIFASFPKALSDAEAREISINPYFELLAPEMLPLYFIPEAVVAGFLPAFAMNSNILIGSKL